jgi:hypothetical protein
MLHSVRDLGSYAIEAVDGDIGRVRDVYFDDRGWKIRYLVADTGHWLAGRRVLISPRHVRAADPDHRLVRAALTRAQITDCPDVATDPPVSRQHEVDFYRYYGLPYAAAMAVPGRLGVRDLETCWRPHERGNPHLRSARAVTHDYVHALDGDIGHVADFLCEDASWTIRHLVVATGSWWPGRKVLVPVEWVTWVSWEAGTVDVHLRSETIKLAPEYDGAQPITPEYLARLAAYYASPPSLT